MVFPFYLNFIQKIKDSSESSDLITKTLNYCFKISEHAM